MATFNGVDLFDLCSVATSPNPASLQVNAYPGVNGLEVLRMGSRGRTSTMTGWLLASDIPTLNSAEIALRTYVANAGAYTFVDNYGNSWPNVILVAFRPTERPMVVAATSLGGTGYCRPFEATFLHLS